MEFKKKDGKIRVLLSGEIDHHTAKRISENIDIIIYTEKPETVFLDFSKVSFMDSSGLAIVAGRKRVCDKLNIKIYVVNATGYTEKILRMSGADRLIEFLEEDNEN